MFFKRPIFKPPPLLHEPTLAELVADFSDAMSLWKAAGFPVVTLSQWRERRDACAACPFWDGSARLGLGRCSAPRCHCTRFKQFLATTTCPHPDGSRWPVLM